MQLRQVTRAARSHLCRVPSAMSSTQQHLRPPAPAPSCGPCTTSLKLCGLYHLIRPQWPPESGWTQSNFHPLDFGIGNKRKKISLFTCLGFSLINSRALSARYEGRGKLVQTCRVKRGGRKMRERSPTTHGCWALRRCAPGSFRRPCLLAVNSFSLPVSASPSLSLSIPLSLPSLPVSLSVRLSLCLPVSLSVSLSP